MTLIRFFAPAILIAFVATARAELPDESLLPGDQSAALTELPSESHLPPYAGMQGSLITTTADQDIAQPDAAPEPPLDPPNTDEEKVDPSANDAPATEPPMPEQSRELPSEQALPEANAARQPADVNDGLPIKGSPDGVPWLRLNLRGHTAPLRTIAFCDGGQRLCTAGDDKSLLIWTAAPGRRGQPPRWAHERTVRWQISRGLRGRIYTVAAGQGAVAIAGEGAMGGNGEILLIDPRSGDLIATLNDLSKGSGQGVLSLSFAPGGKALASLRMDGQLALWKQTPAGLWQATQLASRDGELYREDAELVQELLEGREFTAVAAINDAEVIAPVYARTQDNRLVWRLERYNAATGLSRPLAADDRAAPHLDFVTALAAARGEVLASADGAGAVYLWDLRTSPAKTYRFPPQRLPIVSLGFDETGDKLILGAGPTPTAPRTAVEVWDVSNRAKPRRLASVESSEVIRSCSLSPDGQSAAWTVGARAVVRPLASEATQTLHAGTSPPLRVAFPAEKPFYRIGFGTQPAAEGATPINHVFDTSLLRLNRLNGPSKASWLPADWLSKGWTVRPVRENNGGSSLWFYNGATRAARIPLREAWDGAYRVVCWIPGRDQADRRPFAAAIGTSAGDITLYRTADAGDAPIIRQFRGHTAEITSLAVSLDLRYLASASLDGTMCIWPLAGIDRDEPLIQRWGADFQLVGNELIAVSVRTDGPVYFRGLRDGDRITRLRRPVGAEDRPITAPQEMRNVLLNSDWKTEQITFEYVRGRAAGAPFNQLPSWRQLATLFVDDHGEWAYWSPAGYYDASFEGHKLFGWQINRGLERLPDFFLAAQFRKQLERPRVMSQLLRVGDLEGAFRAVRVEPPANSPDALANAYRLKPEVQILSPADGDTAKGRTKVTARLSVDAAERLAPPKAFANGVVALNRELLSETVEDGRRVYDYQWDVPLPSDERVLVQVIGATENEVTESDSVVVKNTPPPRSSPSKLHFVSVGVNSYRDAEIPKLRLAVKSTQDLLALMQKRTAGLYRLDAMALLDDRATRSSWQVLTEAFSAPEFPLTTSPDDWLVVFLSGHGVTGLDGGGYQFVTADARYADVLAGRYADCLSLADFSRFADIPCRKLVILNTCHGGAMQPLMHREMKAAVRALQDDLVLTLAASGGEEEAVEGRFAARLLEALEGAGDSNGDALVSLGEVVAYVERTVASDSTGAEVRQTPSAGPKELLPFVTAPLSKGGALEAGAPLAATRQRSE